jgi:hypothetical protein
VGGGRTGRFGARNGWIWLVGAISRERFSTLYYDCTEEAEFLYSCVRRTVDEDLPREIAYLRRHDEAIRRIMDVVEMPDRIAEDLVWYVRENKGTLAKKRRRSEFKKLRDDEVASIEGIVREVFQSETPAVLPKPG